MLILIDEEGYTLPTFSNIIEAFKKLSEESLPGDVVFVQFSGHGGRVLDATVDSEGESYDEVVVPLDYKQCGLIRDTLIFKTLLAPMRFGVTVTILIDCCDTGMLLELPYSWAAKSDKKDVIAKVSQFNVRFHPYQIGVSHNRLFLFIKQLAANDDFSFVRFLKVVKTLYESSTFTQLGKTVGSALNPLGSSADALLLEEESTRKSMKNGSKKKSREPKTKYSGPTSESILEALADACSAGRKDSVDTGNQSLNRALSGDKTIQRKENIFDQMMKGCNLLGSPEEDYSDEETFKSRTEDDQSFYSEVDQSYETLTEDEHDTRSRRRRR